MLYQTEATMLDDSESILEPMSTYADRFNEALEQPGKTVAGVAAAMGISKQAVYAIKRGQTKSATADNNAAAAMYFNCNPSWLASAKAYRSGGR
jgi:transcriptional regulator with XRE-family HTH domain